MPETRAVAVPDLAQILVAAKEQVDYNRSLIEGCPDPLIAVGADGRITDANAAFSSITGIPRQKLMESEFAACFSDPELARACVREAFSQGQISGYPLTVRNAFGQLTHLLCSAAPYSIGKAKSRGLS